MTTGWFIFGVVMPAIVAGTGVLYAWAHLRWLRKQDEKRDAPAE
jgi:hypothetical protein